MSKNIKILTDYRRRNIFNLVQQLPIDALPLVGQLCQSILEQWGGEHAGLTVIITPIKAETETNPIDLNESQFMVKDKSMYNPQNLPARSYDDSVEVKQEIEDTEVNLNIDRESICKPRSERFRKLRLKQNDKPKMLQHANVIKTEKIPALKQETNEKKCAVPKQRLRNNKQNKKRSLSLIRKQLEPFWEQLSDENVFEDEKPMAYKLKTERHK